MVVVVVVVVVLVDKCTVDYVNQLLSSLPQDTQDQTDATTYERTAIIIDRVCRIVFPVSMTNDTGNMILQTRSIHSISFSGSSVSWPKHPHSKYTCQTTDDGANDEQFDFRLDTLIGQATHSQQYHSKCCFQTVFYVECSIITYGFVSFYISQLYQPYIAASHLQFQTHWSRLIIFQHKDISLDIIFW